MPKVLRSSGGCLHCKGRKVKIKSTNAADGTSSSLGNIEPQYQNQTPNPGPNSNTSVPTSQPSNSSTLPSTQAQTPAQHPRSPSPHPHPHTQAIPPSISSPFAEAGLPSMLHMELLYHWCTTTSYGLSTSPWTTHMFRFEVPRIGMQSGHTLHSCLALSALHLARSKPAEARKYVLCAASLYGGALSKLARSLTEINEENNSAVFWTATLTFVYALAMPTKPDKLMQTLDSDGSDTTTTDWLLLLRGVLSVSQNARRWLSHKEFKGFAINDEDGGSVDEKGLAPAEEHLLQLKTIIEYSALKKNVPIYRTTIDHLRTTFFLTHNSPAGSRAVAYVFNWAAYLSDDFLRLLSRQENEALAIFAYFAVLLSKADMFWFLDGWGPHLLSLVERSMPPTHAAWIQWPKDEIAKDEEDRKAGRRGPDVTPLTNTGVVR
ncbi:hypothetical protein K402DRAFT_402464 [Aulographum hederae CBS 113979]|uniref:Uncharacterized protein n=1 Tax=Aulographum hederae CBS 113979 TaxID=1176131 RepID=A0A6G1H6R2_9PEZI|nr:hypothetical protein K402DRAFT_402464 [Aulographum hederae CBS 113979]